MSGAAAVLAGAAGVPVGAFLNVVVDHVPSRTPLRAPLEGEASGPARWAGVPVRPWLLSRDRRTRPRRWLAVELATAGLFAAFAARFGDTTALWPVLVLCAALVAVTAVDLEHLRIPDRLTFPALALAVPLVIAVAIERDVDESLRGALIGAVAYFLILLVVHLVSPRGMGFGDVKLALLLGLYLGWFGWTPDDTTGGPIQYVLYGLVLGCLIGVVFGVGHLLVTRDRGGFPFGPALAAGCLVVLLWLP